MEINLNGKLFIFLHPEENIHLRRETFLELDKKEKLLYAKKLLKNF